MSRGKIMQLKKLLIEGNELMNYMNVENKDLQERVNRYKATIDRLSQMCADFADTEFTLRRELQSLKEKNSFKHKLKKKIFG